MKIFPAIDIKDKKCVRLIKGNNPKRIVADTHRTLPQNLKIFNDNESETVILCSSKQFSNNKTSNSIYIATKEKNRFLDPRSMLTELANIGVTSILLEGGPTIIKSFYDHGYIDEVYEYTSPEKIDGVNMKNPIKIDENWSSKDQINLEGDVLKGFQKKEVECLVE